VIGLARKKENFYKSKNSSKRSIIPSDCLILSNS